MATGLPAVVTDVGGNAEVIEHGVSGLLAPAADGPALAQALRQLLRDPVRQAQMGQAARDRFERHFSLRRYVEAHEALYETMLTERAKAPACTRG